MSKPQTDSTTRLYAELTKLDAIVGILELDQRDESTIAVLDVIDVAIGAAGRRADEAIRSGDKQHADAVTDRECATVESLLGAAFIVCQTKITAIVAGALDAYRCLDPAQRANLPFDDKGKDKGKGKVLGLGAPLGSTGHSAVSAMDAIANYFKHHDEWNVTWEGDKPSWEGGKNGKRTRDVVSALELSPNTTGNLRHAAKAFGWQWNEHGSVHVLDRAIAEWTGCLVEFIRRAQIGR